MSAKKINQYYNIAANLTNTFKLVVDIEPDKALELLNEAHRYLKLAEVEKQKLDNSQPMLEQEVQELQDAILNADINKKEKLPKVLIIGGAGFIGSHLAKRLVNDGHEVSIIDNMSTGRDSNLVDIKDRIKFHKMTEQNIYSEIQECDLIVHFAASVGVTYVESNPRATIMNNLMMENTVFSINNKFKKPVLFASTSEVYGRSENVPFEEDDDLLIGNPKELRWGYACSKLMGEFMLRAHDFPFIIVRFFNVVGPRQLSDYGMVIPTFVQKAINGEELEVYGSGNQIRSFCHINDAVEALMLLLLNEKYHNDTYNIGNEDNEIMMKRLAHDILKLKPATLPKGSTVKITNTQVRNSTDIDVRVPDTSKIRNLTGWKPKISIEQIIKDVMEYEINKKVENTGEST